MSEVDLKMFQLNKRANNSGIKLSELTALQIYMDLNVSYRKYVFIFAMCLSVAFLLHNLNLFTEKECIVAMPNDLLKAFRKADNCDFCHDVNQVARVENISPSEFEKKFAYNGKPVIITDATKNWTALEVFDFWYFKNVYENSRKYQKKMNCQFFPYKTEFKSLLEALSIPEDRVNYESGTKPWYFGWSNCNPEVAELLREHYARPYFLPETSENRATDWIFIGGAGLGAHLHVDNVRLPSWQAQIKGKKEWLLAPPPECYYECKIFSATVQTGEISEIN